MHTGYIYIWYDTRAKLFYVGGHYGKVSDSYVCSNKPMKRAYKLRPQTFRFRVLEYVYSNIKELREKEQKWLNMIKDTELLLTSNVINKTVRYYNVKKISAGGSHKGHKKNRVKPSPFIGITNEMKQLRRNGLLCLFCDKPKEKKSSWNKGRIPWNKGKGIKQLIPKPPKQVYSISCSCCSTVFSTTNNSQKCCSINCAQTLLRIAGGKAAGSNNGKSSAKKQSQTVTGRRRKYRTDGSWFWVYPDRSGPVIL